MLKANGASLSFLVSNALVSAMYLESDFMEVRFGRAADLRLAPSLPARYPCSLLTFSLLASNNSSPEPDTTCSNSLPDGVARFICRSGELETRDIGVEMALQLRFPRIPLSVISEDLITYAPVPILGSIEGCPRGSSGCPSLGHINLTISGNNFLGPTSCSFSGTSVVSTAYVINSTLLLCTLPEGKGSQVQVSVTSHGELAISPDGVPRMVEYERPAILRLISPDCSQSLEAAGSSGPSSTTGLLALTDCTLGPLRLSIYGENFGPNGANAFVGGRLCVTESSQAHNHTFLSCITSYPQVVFS